MSYIEQMLVAVVFPWKQYLELYVYACYQDIINLPCKLLAYFYYNPIIRSMASNSDYYMEYNNLLIINQQQNICLGLLRCV